MGIYMGLIWATHKGLMRDLQQGSMLDPYGQSHMGPVWVKSTNVYLPEKKKLHIVYTNDYKSPVPAYLMDW